MLETEALAEMGGGDGSAPRIAWAVNADSMATWFTGVFGALAVRTDGRWLFAASQNTTHRRFAEKLMGKFVSRTVPSPIAGQ